MGNKYRISGVTLLILAVLLASPWAAVCCIPSEGAADPTITSVEFCTDGSSDTVTVHIDNAPSNVYVEMQNSSGLFNMRGFFDVVDGKISFIPDERAYLPICEGTYNVSVGYKMGHLFDSHRTTIYKVTLSSGTVEYPNERSFLISEDSMKTYRLDPGFGWYSNFRCMGQPVTKLSPSLAFGYDIKLYAGTGGRGTVAIDPSYCVVKVNENVTLTAIFTPTTAECAVTWSITSGGDFVKISADGLRCTVTGVKNGTATITATAENGDVATATVVVGIPVESIELNMHEATIGILDTVTLVAKILPEDATDKRVTWSSSDEKIAFVVDGKVVGMSPGIATITATTVDGGFTDACIVTVIDNVYYAETDADGKLTAEEEANILAWLEEFTTKVPTITPKVVINSATEFVECTTHLLVAGSGYGATFDFWFKNGTGVLMTAESIKSMKLADGHTFRISCEVQKIEDKDIGTVMAKYDLYITIDGVRTSMEYNPKVTVSFPYKLAAGQETEYLKVKCLDNGEYISDAEYVETDVLTGMVFDTSHFSIYAIVYEKPSDGGGFPIWAIILIIVAVIAVIAIVLYILHKKGKI